MRTRIKICGITSADDARAVADAGADAIGLIFADSPRQVTAAQARDIVQAVPPYVTIVGIFVNEEVRYVGKLQKDIGFHVAQLHGEESPDYLRLLEVPAIKAFAAKDDSVLETIASYPLSTFLLDTYQPDRAGGTGETFDWNLAVKAKAHGKIILSGGLTPDNIMKALTAVNPSAVDVSSGVEREPGIKNIEKAKDFIQKVHTWDSQTN